VRKLNAFGHEIPPLAQCVHSEQLHRMLFRQLVSILPERPDAKEIAEHLFENTLTEGNDEACACAAQSLLREASALQHIRQGLNERSARIMAQIQPHLIGSGVLDYGCGDGEVGRRISDLGYSVSLCDVMDYRTEAARDLPWHLLAGGYQEKSDRHAMDTLLLLTVLHHCENPDSSLLSVKSLGPKRVISIESVYKLTRAETFRFRQAETCRTADAFEWLELPTEGQFRYACFWDWFYNKVVNSGVFVPYNFLWPDAWRDRFRHLGYDEAERIYLGIDQPLAPEFHVLQVFDAAD